MKPKGKVKRHSTKMEVGKFYLLYNRIGKKNVFLMKCTGHLEGIQYIHLVSNDRSFFWDSGIFRVDNYYEQDGMKLRVTSETEIFALSDEEVINHILINEL